MGFGNQSVPFLPRDVLDVDVHPDAVNFVLGFVKDRRGPLLLVHAEG
jgi:hypothetical protein